MVQLLLALARMKNIDMRSGFSVLCQAKKQSPSAIVRISCMLPEVGVVVKQKNRRRHFALSPNQIFELRAIIYLANMSYRVASDLLQHQEFAKRNMPRHL